MISITSNDVPDKSSHNTIHTHQHRQFYTTHTIFLNDLPTNHKTRLFAVQRTAIRYLVRTLPLCI